MSDLADLFTRNPLEQPFTKEEIELVVAKYREARHKFNTDGKATPVVASKAAPEIQSLAKTLGVKL